MHLYMVRRDYDQAIDFLNDPIFKEKLKSNARLLRDLHLMVDSAYIIENDREIIDIAADLPLRCMDAIRMAAALMSGLDGIITLEPLDFVDNPADFEQMRAQGQTHVLVGELENIDFGIDQIRILVTSPFILVERISEEIGIRLEKTEANVQEDTNADSVTSTSFTRLGLSDWALTVDKEGIKRLYVELEDQFGTKHSIDSLTSTDMDSSLGEIDTLFLTINKCAEQFTKLPEFYLSYTVTSAQGVPSPVKVEIGLTYLGGTFLGVCSGERTIGCTASAYVKALNKVLWYKECGQ